MKEVSAKYKTELLAVLKQAAKNPALLNEFLSDLLTPKEYAEIVTRWQIVKLLAKNIPQREIAKQLKVSIGKITRGSRELLNKRGGFRTMLQDKI